MNPIDPLLPDDVCPIRHADAVSPTDREAVFQIVQESVFQLWEVVNNLTRVQPPKQDRYRVTIFGSARITPDTPFYNGVRNLAGELAAMGCDIITGGGPGLMQAANEGSVKADPDNQTKSIGLRVSLDFEQETNPFVEQVYLHRTFFSRLHHFVLLSNAFVVVPGGIGTALEALTIWQLLQVRKLYDTPLIMVGPMWADFTAWAQHYMVDVDPPMADPADITIPQCVADCEEAMTLLRQAHAKWLRCQL
jgi:predicted Rossmann-fold nucleotide-binding protein